MVSSPLSSPLSCPLSCPLSAGSERWKARPPCLWPRQTLFWSGDLWVSCIRLTQAKRDYIVTEEPRPQMSLIQLQKTTTLGALCFLTSSIQEWTFKIKADRSVLGSGTIWDNLNEKQCCLMNFYKTKRYILGRIHLNPYKIYFIIFNSLLMLCILFSSMVCFMRYFLYICEGCLAPQGCNPSVSVWLLYFAS